MSAARFAVRTSILAVAMFAVQAAWAALVPPARVNTAGAAVLPYLLVSNLLIALVLVRVAGRSPARGGTLVAVLFAVAGGIPLLYLLEVVFFDIGIPPGELPKLFAQATVTGAASAVLTALVSGSLAGTGGVPTPLPLRPGRLAAAAAIYVVCYVVAGLSAWPFLSSYYVQRPMPSVTLVFGLQIVRGLALGAIVWWLARHEPGARTAAVLTAGLALSIVGGVAPLIVPGNPYLPDAIRHAHLIEVGISNFVVGAAVAWVMTKPAR